MDLELDGILHLLLTALIIVAYIMYVLLLLFQFKVNYGLKWSDRNCC